MDFVQVLNVAIGLFTVYLVLALVVTALNESIAAMLSSRARWLRRGIDAILSPAPSAPAQALAPGATPATVTSGQVLNSPLLAHLGGDGRGLWAGNAVSYVRAWPLLQAALQSLGGSSQKALATLDDIRTAAAKLPDRSPLRAAVEQCLAECQGSLEAFRKGFEAWFTDFEAQVTAWYRQKTQWVVTGLAVAIACAMNVDTVAVVRQLSSDPAVLKAMSEVGTAIAGKPTLADLVNTQARDERKAELDKAAATERDARQRRDALARASVQAKASAPATAASPASAPASSPDQELAAARLATDEAQRDYDKARLEVDQRVDELLQRVQSTGLRLGWTEAHWRTLVHSDWRAWLNKLAGLLITAAALSLGAPFWFDLLKQLVAIRSVGQNPAERAADAQARNATPAK